MGLTQITEFCAKYTKIYGKNVTKVIETGVNKGVNNSASSNLSKELRYVPLAEDTVSFTRNKFKLPNKAELKTMLEAQGIKRTDRIYESSGKIADFGAQDIQIINDNNSVFLEELLRLFPKKAGEEVNTALQKRMLYLQDIDHSGFSDKQKFLDQFLKDVEEVENILANDGKKLYTDWTIDLYTKKAIIQAKYNNPERYKELTDLIKLHQKGLVPKHNVATFFPEAHFHPLVKSDMQKMLNGENYFPQFTKLVESEIAKIEFGEVFSVCEKMFVKTKDGYEALKIDKQTYERLFPAVERYAASQNGVGNCGKIASWNAMIKNPNSRIEIYRLFEQTPKGVKVNVPSLKYSKEFNWNDLSELNTDKNIQGCLGHKMAELTRDLGYCGKIDTGANPRPLLITHITGKSELTDLYAGKRFDWISDKKLLNEYIAQEKDGIYIRNGFKENLNKGDTDCHYYSTTDLTTGMWQNPWTGVEEMHFDNKTLCIDGSVHSYSSDIKTLLKLISG